MMGSAPSKTLTTVVWATDGSAQSVAASGLVREVCEREESALRIVHIAPVVSTQADERGVAALKALTRSLRRHGVNASLHVVRGAIGAPAGHIADVAGMVDADLVILTTRGRSPLVGAVAGSVTQGLVACAPCPVLVLPAAVVSARAAAVRPGLRQPAA